MESKLTGVRSWMLVGLIAGVAAVPLHATSWSAALSKEELRTSYASTRATPNRQRTIQVGPRDTLWSIARTTRPNNKITIKQAMLAIRDVNPSAFPTGNINEMEVGVRLVIPTPQAMSKRSAMQAEQEVRRQNQAWVASRAPGAPAAKKNPIKPKATTPVATKPQPKPAVKSEPKQQPLKLPDSRASSPRDLTLVAPKANQAQQKRINKLEENLASSEESLQTAEREKDELAERISDMQQQVSTLQQLIQLKDQQLSDMEEQLILEQAQPGASRTVIPKAPEAQDLASKMKRQPELYGALAGSLLLLLILFFALISARKKLKAARKESQPNLNPSETLNTAFAEDQATSKDFDLDLNSQPLEDLDGLEGLGELEPLEFDKAPDLKDDLSTEFNLDSLEDDLSSIDDLETIEATINQEQVNDALQEAETFIAYGRLEQAAGFLQTALTEQPDREDLRIKLLEVLVELNDEETFRQQQQLVVNSASAIGIARAEELANFFAAATSTDEGIATSETIAEDLGELDLGELDLEGLDLGELDLDSDLTEFNQLFPGENQAVDDSTDDLADLAVPVENAFDSIETDLDDLITNNEPLKPSLEDSLDDDDFDLEELDELELDLEKPLDANELADQGDSSADFEPVDYKSDSDDFMQALDSLGDDDFEVATSHVEPQDPQQAPGVDDELAALSENLAELEAFTESSVADTDDLSDLEDFGDLDDLSNLDDLGALGDQDLDDIEGSMSTQLDLATAYIEMGDKEGAREILEKVAKEGDADLKATALQMLESLSN